MVSNSCRLNENLKIVPSLNLNWEGGGRNKQTINAVSCKTKKSRSLIIPREARLINLSGRRPRSGAKPFEFEPNIYLYVYIFPWRCPCCCLATVRKQSMNGVRLSGVVWKKFAYIGKNMRAWSNFNCNVHQYSLDTELSLQNIFPFF